MQRDTWRVLRAYDMHEIDNGCLPRFNSEIACYWELKSSEMVNVTSQSRLPFLHSGLAHIVGN